jgi:hypothetical protein
VKFLTGGKSLIERARERLQFRKVSRSGAKPEPTVTVGMKEDVDSRASTSSLLFADGFLRFP